MDRLHECFDHSYRRLVAQVYAVSGDLTEAEDAVSEAFARAAGRIAAFDIMERPEAWLRTVALNVVRRRARRRALGDRLTRRVHTPVASTGASDEALDLLAALRELPHTQREALALHYLADLPVADIAETLAVPVGTIKARLSRGRRALAHVLEPASAPTPAVASPKESRHG